ncbi:unnamed protein product [Cylicocyclus nassatus]|uniref:Uncharacterized protein n=1 Tax=Cylicocyclus nassatus TaxID=53992 RepID=A0AA36DRE6_CYLNA|nr:unnamed protein product [Cylicocyclus nassatus]
MLRHCAILVFIPAFVISSDEYETVPCLDERFGGEWKNAIVKQIRRFYKRLYTKKSLEGIVRATYDCEMENFDPQKPYLEFSYWYTIDFNWISLRMNISTFRIGIEAGEFGKQTARELRRLEGQAPVRNSTIFIGCMVGASADTAKNFKIYCNYKLDDRNKQKMISPQ